MNLCERLKTNKIFYDVLKELYTRVKYIGYRFAYEKMMEFEFKRHLGYKLNMENPKSFNEKIQWLKAYYRDPIMESCSDKIAVRDIVSKKIGNGYLIPVYGIWESVEDINFNDLPDKFVLKINNSSGRNIICKDKATLDWHNVTSNLHKWFKQNYYYESGEWVYKNIKPALVCEKLLLGEIIDYKFMCFHGDVKLMFTCSDRDADLKVTFFDLSFNKLPFIRLYPCGKNIKKPKEFDKMIELSKILSKNFPFVRVDFYENDGKIYFGELTFFPGNGMEWFSPIEWDYRLGDMIDLSKVRKDYCICKK